MMKCKARVATVLLIILMFVLVAPAAGQERPTLYWGTTGASVRLLQWRLQQWGYYRGSIDGVFGANTSSAVRLFQARNGVGVSGVVDPATWRALGLWTGPARAAAQTPYAASRGVSRNDDLGLLARVVFGEAEGEPFTGQVAVAAVLLNRVRNPRFPNTIAGVVYQPGAFESVSNGQIWAAPPSQDNIRAAQLALSGWDPTYGSLFFWNPYKPVSPWIWTRRIVARIGRHVFGL